MAASALIPASAPIAPQIMESVLLEGDLSRLDPASRVQYYRCVCESVGLNPLTRPLEYLKLNGKLTLYAKRDCTDQLRKIHQVSVTIPSREIADGCYVVTARASMPNGRQDESIGAVHIEGLKGEARSNSLMKAETKAKRRVTLAICGLSFLDESEIDSVRGAVRFTSPDAGELAPAGGSAEAAQQVAREKLAGTRPLSPGSPILEPQPAAELADQAPEDWEEPPAAEVPSDIEQDLHDSIVQIDRLRARPVRQPNRYMMLQAFAALKARYQAINMLRTYYGYLGLWGARHSNEFTDDEEGMAQARGCYKEMSIDVANREIRR